MQDTLRQPIDFSALQTIGPMLARSLTVGSQQQGRPIVTSVDLHYAFQ
jgi:hypothetical protein